MNPDWHDLIQRYVAGHTTEAEATSLQQALKDDEQLRRLYLDYMNLDVALEASSEAAGMIQHAPAVTISSVRSSGWLQWRPLTAAAAGIVFGMFCSSMVWAYVAPRKTHATAIFKEGFDHPSTALFAGLPVTSGVWSGDTAQVVGAEQEVTPKGGRKMLRFISGTFEGEEAKHSAWGDVYRLVDLRGQISPAVTSVRLSAQFDAVRFAAGEEYACSVELCTLESGPAEFPQPLTLPWMRENSAGTALRKFTMKGDGAWQKAMVEVAVTPQTQFVLLHLSVFRRKPFPPVGAVQFTGHYVDDVKLELISQPSPL